MEAGERAIVSSLCAYLQERFEGQEIQEEWEHARDVLVLRVLPRNEGEPTYLVEVSADFLDGTTVEEIPMALDERNLPSAVKEHFRVLVTTEGLEPLPWKQLSPTSDRVDEASAESFPASDPAGLSTIAPDGGEFRD